MPGGGTTRRGARPAVRVALLSGHRFVFMKFKPCLEDCRRALAPRFPRPGGHCFGRQFWASTRSPNTTTAAPVRLSRTRSSMARTASPSTPAAISTSRRMRTAIEKFAPDGIDLGVFASTGLNFAMALAFDSSGNLYAANFGGNTIEEFAPGRNRPRRFRERHSPDRPCLRCRRQSLRGKFRRHDPALCAERNAARPLRQTGLNNPEGLAFDSSGNLYAANNGSEHDRGFFSERRRSRPARHRPG